MQHEFVGKPQGLSPLHRHLPHDFGFHGVILQLYLPHDL